MLTSAIRLFALRPLPWAAFDFPRWQSALAISLIGVLAGLDPSLRDGTPGVPGLPLALAMLYAVGAMWAAYLVIIALMRWWMRRGQRWDGQGDLFNLLVASWAVVDILGTGLAALGVSQLWLLPLWLYSVWVSAKALSAVIPKASVGYSVAGVVIMLVPALVVVVLVMAAALALHAAFLG